MKIKEILKTIYNVDDEEKGYLAYEYYQMTGYPPEMFLEDLGDVDLDKFNEGLDRRKKEHQVISRKSIYRFNENTTPKIS